jgi:hypothetical protein
MLLGRFVSWCPLTSSINYNQKHKSLRLHRGSSVQLRLRDQDDCCIHISCFSLPFSRLEAVTLFDSQPSDTETYGPHLMMSAVSGPRPLFLHPSIELFNNEIKTKDLSGEYGEEDKLSRINVPNFWSMMNNSCF